MKRIKRERGFYKELSAYLKLTNSKKTKKMWAIEYWLKHISDSSKDIRLYARFQYHDELIQALNYINSVDDENEFQEHTLIRILETPRTRREKTIHRSILSSVPHISKFV